MKKKRWKEKSLPDPLEVSALADSLNISATLVQLLFIRNIKSFQSARDFFRPSLDQLHDPFLMEGMDIATSRVISAITGNEKITVYGDYDVDGICSTALLYMFLKQLGANVSYYIPNRLKDGYGISEKGIDCVKEQGTSLMISVDCGITANAEVSYAKTLGIDVIICDHHQPKESIPPAFAVLDPLVPGCNYPFKYLSGAGVAFKLTQGLANRIGRKEMPYQFLDLVALAASADIVPLVDENRVLVKYGIDIINSQPRLGVAALLRRSGIEPGGLSSGQIIFSLAPRINAVGRMGDALKAVELMLTNDPDEAERLSGILESENLERKKIDEETLNEALSQVDLLGDMENNLSIVLHNSGWHPGVIGIVASRLVEKYSRPTVMLTTVDGIAKGSARSIGSLNIYDILLSCQDLLLHFGGHQAAAGLAVPLENLAEFIARFNSIVKEKLADEDLRPLIEIDSHIKFVDLTPKFFRKLDHFTPFGPGNPKPIFLASGLESVGSARIVGTNHLLFCVRQIQCERIFDCIGFGLGDHLQTITNQKRFEMLFTIDSMYKDGKLLPQFKVIDIRPEE